MCVENDEARSKFSYYGNIDVVKFFFGKGGDIHANNGYILKCSNNRQNIEVFKFLIEIKILYNMEIITYLTTVFEQEKLML